jgi:aminoglycoside phosphotransferase (APT) family kinase protein
MTDHTADIYYAVAHRSQREIDSFKTRYEDFNEMVIPVIFKDVLDLTVKKWERSQSWGSSHVVYFISFHDDPRQLVFRANLGINPQPEYVMLTEKLVTDQVADIGIPTNRVLYVDINRKKYAFDFQIQEKLIGNDLEDNFTGSKEEYDAMSYELGQMIARLSELTYEKFGKFDTRALETGELVGTKTSFYDYLTTSLDGDIEYLQNAEILTNKQTHEIFSIFENSKSIINDVEGVLVHHDLADHNIMFSKSKITALFDWEACVVGDSVLDLASCPTWRTHYPREEHLLHGYQSVKSLPGHFREKRDIYRLRTMIWKMVFAIRMNIVTVDRVAKFKTALAPFKI